jgi:peptide deformylase
MDIFEYPSPVLKETAYEVEPGDRDLKRLVRRMQRIMREAPGVGLAANQLGVQKRVIVFQPEEDGEAMALLNPRVVSASEETVLEEEGCLSFPGIVVQVERPEAVVCEGLSLSGDPVTEEADGLLARILQHEIDHLDGVLIIDRAQSEERRDALRRYREARGG